MEANIPRPADLPRSLHLGRRALLVARLAVLALVLLNLQAFRFQLRSAADEHDASAAQSRFEELRKALPASGRVGYISDRSPTDVLRSSGATRRYYLTQYALAPRVVEPGAEHDLVIGNFDELDPASVDAVVFVLLTVVLVGAAAPACFRDEFSSSSNARQRAWDCG